MSQIPTTCPDFVEHPHIVQQKIYSMNGEFKETRLGGCYRCQCADASERQGINSLVLAFGEVGIPASVEQTGGFTMCAYVDLGDGFYIYANPLGAGLYDEEGYVKDAVMNKDESDNPNPALLAQDLKKWLDDWKATPKN
jgi:hypothetical protein